MGTAATEGLPPVSVVHKASSGSASEATPLDSVFETAFLKYYDRIVGVLLRLLGDRGRAEELASDAFWKLYRQSWLADSGGNVGGWLYRTSTNLGIDALRAMIRRRRYEDVAGRASLAGAAASDPLQQVLREEECRQVRAALASLKSSHARILILRASGLSYNELAETLGIKRASVGTTLIRAEAEFAKYFLSLRRKDKQP